MICFVLQSFEINIMFVHRIIIQKFYFIFCVYFSISVEIMINFKLRHTGFRNDYSSDVHTFRTEVIQSRKMKKTLSFRTSK